MEREQVLSLKKMRRGGISVVRREQYVRDDVSCGVQECAVCANTATASTPTILTVSAPIPLFASAVVATQWHVFLSPLIKNAVVLMSSLADLPRPALRAVRTAQTQGRVHVFCNSLHRQARVKAANKTPAMEDAAAVGFFRAHLPSAHVELVTDLEQWAQASCKDLLPSIAWIEADKAEAAVFGPHLTSAAMEEGLADGLLRECRVYDTVVDVHTGEEVAIVEHNRELPGDRVCVDKKGRVVGILSRRHERVFVGRVVGPQMFESQDGSVKIRLRFHPDGSRRLAVTVDCWPRHSNLPLGHVAKDLGPVGDVNAEADAILIQHDVRTEQWDERILRELPAPNAPQPALDHPDRVDLTHLCIASVDPPGCTDIDDALHCRQLSDGVWEVGVHIADVTNYVLEGSALDEEAAERATTVYLVNRRIDMLPHRLSGDLCSLVENKNRHAFSVIWEMNSDFKILKTKFHKSLIRSRRSFTYAQAQALIDSKVADADDQLAASLRGLQKIAQTLRRRRMERGALELSSPTVKFVNSANGGEDVVDVEMYESLDTNSLVEEFMLLANICVANKIWSHFPSIAMLRRHPDPDPGRWNHLMSELAAIGVQPASSSSKDVAEALKTAPVMARVLVTRHMQQAVYFCSSSVSTDDYRHYGLACPVYTHFTSPIRRYADVVVHRLLAAAIGYCGVPRADARRVARLARHINHRHRMAQLAGRASAEAHSKKVLSQKGKVRADATVLSLLEGGKGARCVVPSLGIEVLVTTDRPGAVAVLDEVVLDLSIDKNRDQIDATLVSETKKQKK